MAPLIKGVVAAAPAMLRWPQFAAGVTRRQTNINPSTITEIRLVLGMLARYVH